MLPPERLDQVVSGDLEPVIFCKKCAWGGPGDIRTPSPCRFR